MTTLEVASAGMFTTVQDLGRTGWRGSGVGPGGAIDPVSHRIANLLVGNPDDAAALEITLLGPRLLFPTGSWVAITGATSDAVVTLRDGASTPLPGWHPVWVPAGATLACGAVAADGCRQTLAIGGGIDVPVVLGGRSTDVRSRFGGFEGRAIRAGDRLPIGIPRKALPAAPQRLVIEPRTVTNELRPTSGEGQSPERHAMPIRVLRGPEFDDFPAASRAILFSTPFSVTPDCDRSGCRLSGPALVAPTMTLSEVVAAGTIQVPPSGQPIVLAADHPVTGGYPRIAVVATIDLPRIGQTRPGHSLRFVEIGIDEAITLVRQREQTLATFRCGLEYLP